MSKPLFSILFFLLSVASLQAFSGKAIAADGRLSPQGGMVHVASSAGGSIVKGLKVKRGDWVHAGDVIAELSHYNLLLKKVEQSKASLATISASLVELDFEIKGAQAQLDLTAANEEETTASHRALLGKLKGEIEDYEWILKNKSPPRRDAEEIKFALKKIKREIQELENKFPSLLSRLQAEFSVAQAALESVKAKRGRIDAQIKEAQSVVSLAEMEAETGRVLAPTDGEVIAINTKPGERESDLGIVTLANTKHMLIEAEVYIDDLASVEVGAEATATSAAFEGEIEGKVIEIEHQVVPNNVFNPNPTAFTDHRVVIVYVQLDEQSSERVQSLGNAQVIVRIESQPNAQ